MEVADVAAEVVADVAVGVVGVAEVAGVDVDAAENAAAADVDGAVAVAVAFEAVAFEAGPVAYLAPAGQSPAAWLPEVPETEHFPAHLPRETQQCCTYESPEVEVVASG